MHGVRTELLEQQAERTGIPLERVEIPFPCTNEQYEKASARVLEKAMIAGVQAMAFGDLFLEDVRDYRMALLAGTPLEATFPLWRRDTSKLAREMLASGLSARVTCLEPRVLPAHFAGATYDTRFLDELPSSIDPCGENGEFHTFATQGPMFDRPIEVEAGDVVERDGFVFADLKPAAD